MNKTINELPTNNQKSNNGLLPGNKILVGDMPVKFDKQFMAEYMGVPNITNQNMAKILTKAYAEGLNPLTDFHVVAFAGKCDLIERVENKLKRAMSNKNFNGIKQGVFVLNKNDELEKRQNEIFMKGIDQKLIGAWCEIEHKEFGTISKEINFDEFDKGKSTWSSMPVSMIVKVARGQALDLAFPNLFGGIYTEEEVNGHTEAEFFEKPQKVEPVEPKKLENSIDPMENLNMGNVETTTIIPEGSNF